MFRINTNTLAMNALRNLDSTGRSASVAMTRLSSGMRINSAADDPAGLQISEGLRTQLASVDQALRNNQDAQNYAKTAEGALGEVSGLLRQARALALANSNDATLSTDQKQANQSQLQSIVASIDRIAQQTQYGSKKLLDGSAGVTTAIINRANIESASIGGTFGSTSNNATVNANGNVAVAVTTAAVKASATGMAATANAAIGSDGQITINNVTFNVTANMTHQNLIDAINARASDTGVKVAITAGNYAFTATNFGTASNSIQITNNAANIGFAAVGTRTLNATTSGVDAVATFQYGSMTSAVALTAQSTDGRTFKDSYGNTIRLSEDYADTTSAAANGINVTAGSANFQIGANAGQTTSLSLANMGSSQLGVSALDITTSSGVSSALSALDTAIATVGVQRGNIGNFVRNTLEASYRSLGVAKENLSAANSSIQDADMSEEMTNFTKLQILQQSGLAMLSQANSSSQAVLSLLRG